MRAKTLLPGDSRTTNPLVFRQVEEGRLSSNRDAAAQDEDGYEQRVLEAHAAGRREGEAAGHKRAADEYQAVMERMAQSIQELAGLRARLRREAETDLVQLALAIARRILGREMAIDPDALRGLVIAALEKLQGQDISRVKVHPSQTALMTACLQKAMAGSSVEVVADPSREPGSAIFETAHGNLDASVDAQLEEIGRGLADCLRKQS